MALNLSGIFGDIGNLASGVSGQDIVQSILAGAAGTVVISGLKSQGGQDAVDPLHLFHHNPAPGAAPATGVVQGNVITMSKFMALSKDQQAMFQALNYTIIPG